MRITRINTFMAAEGMGDQLRSALLAITPLLRKADGCAGCRVVRNLERPDELLLVERWTSAAAQAASARRIPPEKIAELVPLLAGPPQGLFYRE